MAKIDEVIEALTEALNTAEEIADRGEINRVGRDAATDAITQIRQGRYGDAITTLEREFLPKFTDKASAEAAYKRAMLV